MNIPTPDGLSKAVVSTGLPLGADKKLWCQHVYLWGLIEKLWGAQQERGICKGGSQRAELGLPQVSLRVRAARGADRVSLHVREGGGPARQPLAAAAHLRGDVRTAPPLCLRAQLRAPLPPRALPPLPPAGSDAMKP